MRIDDVIATRTAKTTVKARVFGYVTGHPDEVFGYRDPELARETGVKPSAVGFALWSLHEKGYIAKVAIDGKVYFGATEAIRALQQHVLRGEDDETTWKEVDRFREKMYGKYGYVDLKDLLEETREGL